MKNNRRKDDERIATLLVLVKQVHLAMFGNGKSGMKSEFDEFKGMFRAWRYIAGGGGAVAGLLLILQIIKFVKGI